MAGVLPRTRFLAGTKTKTGKLRHKSPTSKTMIKAILRNGRLLASVDHRSAWMRRYRDLMIAHTNDLGGPDNVSHSEKVLIQRAAMIALQCEFIEERWSRNGGEATTRYELEDYQRAANNLRRMLLALGLQRRSRNVTPNLANYLRSNDANVTDDNVIDEAAE